MIPAEHRFATIIGVIVIVAIIDFLIRTHIEETRRQRQYNKDIREIWEHREAGGNHPGPKNPTPPPTGPISITGERLRRPEFGQQPLRDPYRVPAGPPKTGSGVPAKARGVNGDIGAGVRVEDPKPKLKSEIHSMWVFPAGGLPGTESGVPATTPLIPIPGSVHLAGPLLPIPLIWDADKQQYRDVAEYLNSWITETKALVKGNAERCIIKSCEPGYRAMQGLLDKFEAQINKIVYVSSPADGRTSWESNPQQQRCKACGRPDKFDFHVPDEVWAKVVPPQFQNHVVCLACFDSFAKAKGINYASDLKMLCFAGEKASFEFTIQHAIDVVGK